MKTIPISHVLAALGFAALAILAAIYIPEQRLEKLADLVGRIVEDPAGALAAVSLLGGAIATLRAAWLRQPPPPPPPPAAPPSAGGDSDGPPTRPRRVTMPSTAARVGFDASEKRALDTSLKLLNAWHRETRRRIPRLAAMHKAGAIALVTMAIALTGCGASALRTHSTIATIARVSVVTAGDAVALTCETALARCGANAACVERTGGDCRTAATAAEAAIAGVRAYVDVIEVAARADEGQIGEALDLALQAMARVYESVRETFASLSLGVTLPPLPPVAVAIVRALVGGVTS
jgi:hypothetical protein